MLHESLNIFFDRVGIFRLRERLNEDTLTLGILHLLDAICVYIELFQELESPVRMTICSF